MSKRVEAKPEKDKDRALVVRLSPDELRLLGHEAVDMDVRYLGRLATQIVRDWIAQRRRERNQASPTEDRSGDVA